MLPKTKRSPERADFLTTVLTTALEGGIGYWSQAQDYRWYYPDSIGASHEDVDKVEGIANAYVTLYEEDSSGQVAPESDDPDLKVVTIGVDDIARALGIIRSKAELHLSDSLRADIVANDRGNGEADGDHQDMDAALCDIVVQVAVFGDVNYG